MLYVLRHITEVRKKLPESFLFHHLDPGTEPRSSGLAAISLDAEPSQQPTQRFPGDTVLFIRMLLIKLFSRFCGDYVPK